jgi:hypothetical protein
LQRHIDERSRQLELDSEELAAEQAALETQKSQLASDVDDLHRRHGEFERARQELAEESNRIAVEKQKSESQQRQFAWLKAAWDEWNAERNALIRDRDELTERGAALDRQSQRLQAEAADLAAEREGLHVERERFIAECDAALRAQRAALRDSHRTDHVADQRRFESTRTALPEEADSRLVFPEPVGETPLQETLLQETPLGETPLGDEVTKTGSDVCPDAEPATFSRRDASESEPVDERQREIRARLAAMFDLDALADSEARTNDNRNNDNRIADSEPTPADSPPAAEPDVFSGLDLGGLQRLLKDHGASGTPDSSGAGVVPGSLLASLRASATPDEPISTPELAATADGKTTVESDPDRVGPDRVGPDRVGPDPVEVVHASAPENPAEEPAAEEDSIASYMERLLARNRNPGKGSPPAGDLKPTPSDSPVSRPVPVLQATVVPSAESSTAGVEQEPVARPRRAVDREQLRAGHRVFREVANISARSAVARSLWKRSRTELSIRAMITAFAFVFSILVFTQVIGGSGLFSLGGWTSLAIGLVSGFRLFSFLRETWAYHRQQSESARILNEALGSVGSGAEQTTVVCIDGLAQPTPGDKADAVSPSSSLDRTGASAQQLETLIPQTDAETELDAGNPVSESAPMSQAQIQPVIVPANR